MLNTFFFGYLSLKWCRLVRTISVLLLIYIPFYIDKSPSDIPILHVDTVFFMVLYFPFVIGLLSWLIKPFVVKED